jgi:endonuclease/exonuclease/phosphatase family metal-dependent hydrolase
MSLRVLSWNLNHRARAKAIPSTLADSIASLKPNVIVLNEYVHGDSRQPFLEQLAKRGFPYWQVSHVTPLRQNHVLIPSRTPIDLGCIKAPAIEKFIPSNFLHVSLPHEGCEILGLRIPDYSNDPKTKRACWNWIIETATTVKDRPFVLIGDFNTDPDDPDALFRDCPGRLIDGGWQLASPGEGASYWTVKGKPYRLDHAFVSQHFTVLESRYVSDFGALGSIGHSKDALSDHAILWIDIERRAGRSVTISPQTEHGDRDP